ncbi:DUF2860 domain-containing protein [Motilimonas cestriensis]|uniref:DUF2860 domain-containing protein n=1 Tax=Motilimonas cestriensis TaxID=2742685 RepID=A0ABS8WBZ3_9GAMM|nr:DUF2860 family protein [Motilimonas cestriensis]MCE2595817.1 DUF2860 domain-containing protein [Motilimonas cestriensis]
MNKILSFASLAILFATSVSYAAEREVGWHGQVSAHVGMMQKKSQFNTDENKTITQLGAAQEQGNSVLVFPMWDINYGLQQVAGEFYFQSDLAGMASNFYMEAGYRHYLTDGSRLGFGVIPGVLGRETWQDPYLLGAERQTTDAVIRGLVVNYDNIGGSSFSIELAAGQRELDEEKSGASVNVDSNLLVREGDLYYAQLSQQWNLSADMGLEWQLHYLQDNADGAAMENQRYGLEVEFTKTFGRHILLAGGQFYRQDYQASHPVFLRKRQDDLMGLSGTYVYAAPFNWPQTLLIARIGWDNRDSNIDFYNEEEVLATVGMSYQF